MLKSFTLSVIALLLVMQSCVTAKIESNKDASYTKQPKRIFILVNTASQATDFTTDFIAGFQKKLIIKGVTSSSYTHTALSFETNDDVNKKITDYSPDAVLIIKQIEVHSTNKMVDGGKFEISLLDYESKKKVWKSDFDVYGSMGLSSASDKSVDELIKKMEEDKII